MSHPRGQLLVPQLFRLFERHVPARPLPDVDLRHGRAVRPLELVGRWVEYPPVAQLKPEVLRHVIAHLYLALDEFGADAVKALLQELSLNYNLLSDSAITLRESYS